MKKIVLYIGWLVLYAICAGLGFVENPVGLQKWAQIAMAVIFFVPGYWLLADSLLQKDKKGLSLLGWISGLSLGLTTAVFIANVFSALGSTELGDTLYSVLILVSVPMVCSRYWFFSLFLWACLFFSALWGRKKL